MSFGWGGKSGDFWAQFLELRAGKDGGKQRIGGLIEVDWWWELNGWMKKGFDLPMLYFFP